MNLIWAVSFSNTVAGAKNMYRPLYLRKKVSIILIGIDSGVKKRTKPLRLSAQKTLKSP